MAPHFKVGDAIYPLVGFASKPWDFDSACIAVVETSDRPEDAVTKCRQLGAPIVWVQHDGIVDWWVQHSTGPRRFESKPVGEFASLVRSYLADLAPRRVYIAKLLGRLPGANQLAFVDAGLMPLLRIEAGQKMGELAENMTRATLRGLGGGKPSRTRLRQVFTRVFRLLAGKILKDKDVDGFGALDLQDPATVLSAVAKHYNAAEPGARLPREWKVALRPASELISGYGNVRVVSPESLAYVYEHTLVNKDLRKKLGIHATPPYLVDYIVWQLYDWIRDIPAEDRHVFEPACGHAPFLLTAMRMLRLEMQGERDRKIHGYLKAHIHGLDMDDFALEIARLSLTLADIPNPNGWDLKWADMYASDVLAEEARKCRIMLSNPPYEAFGEAEKRRYKESAYEVRYKKAVEMLSRTLPELPVGSVFGVLVPQAVINGPEAREVREILLRDFELAEVCRFPGRVFEFAEMETAVVLGRRHSKAFDPKLHRVRLRSVGEHGLPMFVENYSVEEDQSVPQSRLQSDPRLVLTVPALNELWIHLESNPRISSIATVGRGIEFKGEKARNGVPVVLEHPKPPDYPPGFAGVARTTQEIFVPPPLCGLAVRPELIENPRQGLPTNQPQVLINRARTSRSPWRVKALLDADGIAIKDNFVVVRPSVSDISSLYLWAVLNSPIASAYAASRTTRRHNLEGILREVPIPRLGARAINEVVTAAQAYRDLVATCLPPTERKSKRKSDQPSLFQAFPEAANRSADSQICHALLAMDAGVLKAYGLPPRLERQLLDFFRGVERKGVGCSFTGYFPADFEPTIPLWMYVSDDFRRCRADYLISQVPHITDPVLVDALAEAE
ncbi:MAG: hypothetical protein A2Y76_01425 [Planctomycetes bacterium RBG_13_60_9]|nr:MAG: hypothetical protein A2Y76_01425 [Planctomycetes bacterium RBG_13_60_9]